MHSERYVAVGGSVPDAEVVALLGTAVRAGIGVQAAALRPPGRSGARTGDDAPYGADALSWHRLRAPVTTASVLGGVVQQVARRVLRGEAAELVDALLADPWLERTLAAGAPPEHPGSAYLVALDDAAAQALGRWRGVRAADVPVLTWDKAAERLAEETAARRAAEPGGTGSAGVVPRAGRPGATGPAAMHRVTVAVPPGAEPREALRAVLPRLRARVTVLRAGAPVPEDTDVLVLDGLGPVVAQLPLPAGVRVVHLPRLQDRSSPWRHLLAGERTVVGPAGGALPAEEELGELVLGEDVAALVRLARARDDDAALALVADRLAGSPTDPVLLREMAYVTRVTGALTLEHRVLQAMAAVPGAGGPLGDDALERVADELLETEPGWLPPVPATTVDAVPGRVLHVLRTTLPQREDGYGLRGHQALRALVADGADVVAVAAPERAAAVTAGSPAPAEVLFDGVRYLLPAPVHAASSTAYLEAAAAALLDVVVRERPAVLHVHSGHRGYDLGVLGAALADATGLPWVYEVRAPLEATWTADGTRAERGETFARRMAREAELAARADATVTVTATMRADLLARGVPADKVEVVPNGVDPDRLPPVARDPGLARHLDAVGRFTFGCVTDLDSSRDQVEDLVRAAVLVTARGRPALCLVVGGGSRLPELRALTDQLGGGGYVTSTGHVPHDQVGAFYAQLDVLVVPRSRERAARLGAPLAPSEAMATGVPVVVSALPGPLEVVGGGERGWSYPAGDAAALADLLQRLAEDRDGRARVAARARDWVVTEGTWPRNAARYRALYGTLNDAR